MRYLFLNLFMVTLFICHGQKAKSVDCDFPNDSGRQAKMWCELKYASCVMESDDECSLYCERSEQALISSILTDHPKLSVALNAGSFSLDQIANETIESRLRRGRIDFKDGFRVDWNNIRSYTLKVIIDSRE